MDKGKTVADGSALFEFDITKMTALWVTNRYWNTIAPFE